MNSSSKDRETTKVNYEKLIADNYSKTLGTLVKLFRQHIKDIETADALDYAKTRRNFFAHSILRKYGWWEMSDAEYRMCIFEIFEIRSAIKTAEDKLFQYLNDSTSMKIVRIALDPMAGEISIRSNPK